MPLPIPSDADTKWTFNVPHAVDLYFRQQIIARGWMQKIGCQLAVAFHTACVAEGITTVYDLDKEDKVAKVLARINFNSTVPPPVQIESQPRQRGKRTNGP